MLTRTEQSILMQNRLFAGLSEAELSGLLEKKQPENDANV